MLTEKRIFFEAKTLVVRGNVLRGCEYMRIVS